MKIHYFQRYHKNEDVATANTMLLLSRLYMYSSEKFFQFLKEQCFSDVDFEPELSFVLQDKGKESVPDATITQPSFKIVIETKIKDWFYKEQLIKHLQKFQNEEYKVLITLSNEYMKETKKIEVDSEINKYNLSNKSNVIHVNTTFENIAKGVQDVLTDRDHQMQDVLMDYFDYCYRDNLIIVSDSCKKMLMQRTGMSLDFNIKENVYYNKFDKSFSPHDYLGLYKQKSIKAIGKISAIISAVDNDGTMEYFVEKGELTEDKKETIARAIKNGKTYNFDMSAQKYYFVEKFYETDFVKTSKRAPMGPKFFDLTEVLKMDELPPVNEIAEMLKNIDWK